MQFGLIDDKPGWKVAGADTLSPFSSKASGTLVISYSMHLGTNASHMYTGWRSASFTIILQDGIVISSRQDGHAVSTHFAGDSSTTYKYDWYRINSVTWTPA